MKNKYLVIVAAGLMCLASCAKPAGTSLPRAEDGYVNTSDFHKAFQAVECNGVDEMHSLMVLKDGKVVYEEYMLGHSADELHILWSASKSFTSLAVGFAVDEGLLSVDDKVLDFFDPSLVHGMPSDTLQRLTIKNLLTMSSGFSRDYISVTHAKVLQNPTETMLNTSFAFMPGERFQYNSMNSYLLSAIVTKVTGKKLADYLNEKLFIPLGIDRYLYEESAEGINPGGWGLYLQTESMAKVGQLVLDKGMWNGQRIISEKWIDEATAVQITEGMSGTVDWRQGYGYQIWNCTHNAKRFDGGWGQYVIIIPEKNAVVAVTSHASNLQNVVSSIWDNVLPAL